MIVQLNFTVLVKNILPGLPDYGPPTLDPMPGPEVRSNVVLRETVPAGGGRAMIDQVRKQVLPLQAKCIAIHAASRQQRGCHVDMADVHLATCPWRINNCGQNPLFYSSWYHSECAISSSYFSISSPLLFVSRGPEACGPFSPSPFCLNTNC